MTGVPNGRESFNIRYTYKDNNEVTIANREITSHNFTEPLTYEPHNNPFDKNRISGSLNLVNGNGTAIFELKNIQYDESGVFNLEIFKAERRGVNVEVQGKRLLRTFCFRMIIITIILFIYHFKFNL